MSNNHAFTLQYLLKTQKLDLSVLPSFTQFDISVALKSLSPQDYWLVVSLLPSETKQQIKLKEFLILSKYSKVALCHYMDLAIASKNVKYLNRVKDLLELEFAKSEETNTLYCLAILRKLSSCKTSAVA